VTPRNVIWFHRNDVVRHESTNMLPPFRKRIFHRHSWSRL
jgi:hypothetical protein